MEGREILKRSSLLSLLLLIAIAFVGARTYALWQEGSWKLPEPGNKRKGSSAVQEARKKSQRPQLVKTKDIIEKNLFHPERGAGMLEGAGNVSQDIRELKDLALLGTVITPTERYAIVQLPPDSGPSKGRGKRRLRAKGRTRGALRRLTLGDTLEGFKLAEIHAQRVVFKKGSSTVEVALDFSRKVIQKVKKKVKTPKKVKNTPKARKPRRARKKER